MEENTGLATVELFKSRQTPTNRHIDKLTRKLEANQKSINELEKLGLDNGEYVLDEYVRGLKMKIDLATETQILKLRELNGELINKVDCFKSECIKKLKLNKINSTKMDKIKEDFEDLKKKSELIIENRNLNENEFTEAMQSLVTFEKKAINEIRSLKNHIFDHKDCFFVKSKLEFTEKSIGSLTVKSLKSEINEF